MIFTPISLLYFVFQPVSLLSYVQTCNFRFSIVILVLYSTVSVIRDSQTQTLCSGVQDFSSQLSHFQSLIMSPRRFYKINEFVAHGSAVTCLALDHRNGQLMVTGGDDSKINVWSIGTKNCIMSLNGHRTSVECAMFHQNSDILGAGSASGAIKLWDLKEAKLLHTLVGHKANVRCIDFHPYGQFMASGSFDTTIKLWDYRKKGCVCTYRAHTKDIHCLKLSPDGRWLASGGNEGVVVLYDIVAGKVFAELKGHGASITDVTFHPNEFLLASSSLDGTVKFWDLENFQQISTSSYSSDMGPVRKIGFHPSGKGLFASSRDCLKVFSWEPTRVYDTVKVSWGRPNDVAVLDNQLVAGAYSTTNVSVFLVDLANVSPFSTNSAKSVRDSPIRKSTRKSFTTNDRKTLKILENFETNELDSHSSDGDESFAEVHTIDYKKAFKSRRELVRTPPLDSGISSEDVSLIDIPGRVETLDTILAPLPKSVSHNSFTPSSKRTSPTIGNATMRALSESMNSLNIRSSNRSASGLVSQSGVARPLTQQTTTQSVNCATQLSPLKSSSNHKVSPATNKATSVVKPVVSNPQRGRTVSVHLPPQAPTNSENVRTSIDFNDFLPKHIQKFGFQAAMSEEDAIHSVLSGHMATKAGLDYRLKQVQVIFSKFTKDPKLSIEHAIGLDEISVVVDLLNMLLKRQTLWTLDICLLLLPTLQELLESKYETYVNVGCSALALILKTFGSTIKSNVTAGGPPGIGVDITREERHNKCLACYNLLVRARAFVLKRQTVSGATGRAFRNLSIQMETLD